jgi:DNA-binding response OmpR family regulator
MNESTNEPIEDRTRSTHRILVMGEDPVLLNFNVEVLLRHGYEVKAAEDGATAWKELLTFNYNLLITDYKLLKVTGVGLIKKLHSARLSLPVVLVAEKAATQRLAKYPWLHPAATLLKPIAVEVLLDTVKNVLRATRSAPDDNLADRASTITPGQPLLGIAPLGARTSLRSCAQIMEPGSNIAEWRQTGPGIWSQILD